MKNCSTEILRFGINIQSLLCHGPVKVLFFEKTFIITRLLKVADSCGLVQGLYLRGHGSCPYFAQLYFCTWLVLRNTNSWFDFGRRKFAVLFS